MDGLIMQYFLEDDVDGFEELIDLCLPKTTIKNEDDFIYKQLKSACIGLAVSQNLTLNSETLRPIYEVYNEETSFSTLQEHSAIQTLGKRKNVIKSKSKKKRIKLSQSSSKDVTSDFIDSDIEDEQIQKYIKSRQKKQLGKKLNLQPNNLRSKMRELRMYDPFEDKTDEEFFENLRVTKTTYNYLLTKIKQAAIFSSNFPGGNYPVRAEQALQMFLFYMGQRCTYRVLSEMFHLSESAIMSSFLKCVEGINRLDDEEISWPNTVRELEEVQSSFQDISRLPGVVGSIGGCCIEMRTNKEPPAGYKIGKLRSIMFLLAVTDAQQRFLYIQAGFPGTFCVQEAFESSSLGEMMKVDSSSLFISDETHLIGNNDFSLQKHLLIPFSELKKLSVSQKNFNTAISESNVVEKTFLSLKSRFTSLREQLYANLEKIPNIIKACCIIHNISLRDPDDSQFLEGYLRSDFDDYSSYRDDSDFLPNKPDRDAFEKRERISLQLDQPES